MKPFLYETRDLRRLNGSLRLRTLVVFLVSLDLRKLSFKRSLGLGVASLVGFVFVAVVDFFLARLLFFEIKPL